MIFETDVTKILYVAAWNRQDHTTCIWLIESKRPGVSYPVRDEIDRDYVEEAEAHGVTVGELLGGSSGD